PSDSGRWSASAGLPGIFQGTAAARMAVTGPLGDPALAAQPARRMAYMVGGAMAERPSCGPNRRPAQPCRGPADWRRSGELQLALVGGDEDRRDIDEATARRLIDGACLEQQRSHALILEVILLQGSNQAGAGAGRVVAADAGLVEQAVELVAWRSRRRVGLAAMQGLDADLIVGRPGRQAASRAGGVRPAWVAAGPPHG